MNRQLAWIVFLLVVVMLLSTGCRSELPARFSRYSIGLPVRGPQVTVTIMADDAWLPGETATMTVTWTDSTAPYTIAADMGGGTTKNVPAGTPAASPFAHVFTLVDLGTYTYTVTITDANGNVATATGPYNVDGSQNWPGNDDDYDDGGNGNNQHHPPQGPLSLSASYNRLGGNLSIVTAHSDHQLVTVQIDGIPKWVMVPGGPTHVIESGNGTLNLMLALLADDSNSCELEISASDAEDNSDSETVEIKRPLFIDQAYYHPGKGAIEVIVDAEPVQAVSASLTVPGDVSLDGAAELQQDGGGEYLFPVSWNELTFNGGTAVVNASDQLGNQDQEEVPLYTVPGSYEPDTLYAFPIQRVVAVGEPALIIVATGVPAAPFQYMNGVRVTFDAGEPQYVPGSFNVGAPGRETDAADGIWAAVQPKGFLLASDYMLLNSSDYREEENLWMMDFNVTPLGGIATTDAGGELFNFKAEFSQAGFVTLGFEEFHDVKRTYYSDEGSTEYYWGDISNDYPNALNEIYVE